MPVLAARADMLWAAGESGDRLLTGGRKPHRRSVTTVLLHRVAGGQGMPPIEPGRLLDLLIDGLRPFWG